MPNVQISRDERHGATKAANPPRHNVPITQLREMNEPIASLTPRSFEACRRLGIDPQTLQPSVLGDFLEEGGKGLAADKVVAEKKLRHATQRRARNIELITEEREKAIREAQRLAMKQHAATTGDLKSIGIAGPDSSTLMEMERKRLEKVEFLRKKEMERVRDAQRKTAEILSRNAAREARELAEKEARDKARRQRIEENARKAAAMALERKAKMEDNGEKERELKARFQEAERRKLELQKEEEEKRRIETERAKADAAAADLQRRKELEAREEERLEQAHRRLEAMKLAEEVVQQRMDEAKQQRAQAMLERRRAAEERIERALQESAARQQKVLTDFEQKTREAQQRAAANEAALRKQLAEEARIRDAKHAHKRETKERAEREEEERVQRLLAEANTGEEVMAENKAKRDREIALRKLDHDLKLADKVEICNSYQRAQEYQRFLIAQKIARDDARAERLRAEREALIAQRKANAKEQLTRKHELMRNLERMQVQNSFLDFESEGKGKGPKGKGKRGSKHDTV